MRRALPTFLVFVAILQLAGPAGAAGPQLYKSVTPQGQIVYSDRPPPDEASKVVTVEALPASRLPEQALRARAEFLKNIGPVPESRVVAPGEVQLFSASWCRYCRDAKAWLAQRGVAYRDFDVDTPLGQQAQARAGGGGKIPFIVANGHRVTGFSPAAYERVFAVARN